MATVTEMRAWLREQGEDVPDRGRLRPELVDIYLAAHPDGDDWPDDDTLDELVDGPDTAEVAPEVRPSRKRTRRTSSQGMDSLVGRVLFGERKQQATGKTTRKPKQRPRVSLERFTGRLYSMAGRVLEPLSPAAAACVKIQGPMAGVMLEDIVKGTVVDRMLQPVARAEEKLDVAFALVMPPVACMAIEMSYAVEQTPQTVFRRTVAVQMLREGLRTGLEISDKYADQIEAARERAARSDAEVDRLIAMIFPQPTVEHVPEGEMAGAAA